MFFFCLVKRSEKDVNILHKYKIFTLTRYKSKFINVKNELRMTWEALKWKCMGNDK